MAAVRGGNTRPGKAKAEPIAIVPVESEAYLLNIKQETEDTLRLVLAHDRPSRAFLGHAAARNVLNRINVALDTKPLNDWRDKEDRPTRKTVLIAAMLVGYPVLETDLKPGAWMKRAGKVDAFRAQKRALGVGA